MVNMFIIKLVMVMLLQLLWYKNGVQGEIVTVTVKEIRGEEHCSCILPSFLKVNVENTRRETVTEMILSKNDAISTNTYVHVATTAVDGSLRIRTVDVSNKKGFEPQGYHNQSVGAAFVIHCDLKDKKRLFVWIDGSVYLRGQKLRIHPPSQQADIDEATQPGDVTGCYTSPPHHMGPLWEHPSYDAAGISLSKISPSLRRGQSVYFESGRGKKDLFMKSQKPPDPPSLKFRYRRATQNYFVDILPVIDFSMYSRWLSRNSDETQANSELNNYLMVILTAVDMRLQTLSLGDSNLRVRMVAPVISIEASSSSYIENIKFVSGSEVKVSATSLLQTFSDWVIAQKATLPSYDHVMLLTSYDLVAVSDPTVEEKNITRGLAYIGTLCGDRSISLVEDLGAYQSENVAAHELGHSLGAVHDGQDNQCQSRDRYLMATGTFPQTAATRLNPWVFSPCSSSSIAAYLAELEADSSSLNNCLLDQTGNEVNETTTVTAQTICENFLGDGAFPCRNFTDFSEICYNLYCRLPGTSLCQAVTSASGTCCGNGKKCLEGSCVDAEDGECPIDDECPLGDQPSITLNGITTSCDQISSTFCYIEDLRNACCQTCRQYQSNVTGCTYGDKETGCSANQCGGTIVGTGLSYDFICCQTCQNTGCQDASSFTVTGLGQNYTCPQLIGEQGKYVCYLPAVHVDFCCQECESLRDKESEDCPYGDAANCDPITSAAQCTSNVTTECCETCARLRLLETTTSSITSPTAAATTQTSTLITSTPDASTETTSTVNLQSSEATAATTATIGQTAVTTTTVTTQSETSPAGTVVAATTTPPAPTRDETRIWGYKPDGFIGCYIPPCRGSYTIFCWLRNTTFISICLIFVCLLDSVLTSE